MHVCVCVCVCRLLYVLRASHALVEATVGVGTVIIVYIGVAYTRGRVETDIQDYSVVVYWKSTAPRLHPHGLV